MPEKDSIRVRLMIFLLAVVLTGTTFLVVRLNPIEIDLPYLVLLNSVVAVGLLTNLWGGLLVSAVAAFLVIIVNQFAGIYPNENYVVNLSSELVGYLVVGPLAGFIANLLSRMRHRSEHWLRQAEEHTIHDEIFGTLKPEWIKLRLDEEVMRAVRYQRPLAVALLELRSSSSPSQPDRIAALKALIRLVSSATLPPSVVAHTGSNQVLLMLPEYNPTQAQALMNEVKDRAKTELYYPPSNQLKEDAIAIPLEKWGQLLTSLVSLDGIQTTQELLNQAQDALLAEEK